MLSQKHLVKAFQRLSKEGGEHKVEPACTKLVPVDFVRIQDFGDLVQGPRKPKILLKCQKAAGKVFV